MTFLLCLPKPSLQKIQKKKKNRSLDEMSSKSRARSFSLCFVNPNKATKNLFGAMSMFSLLKPFPLIPEIKFKPIFHFNKAETQLC